jgi:hypothetical protein
VRIFGLILFAWSTASFGVAIVLGRVLRWLSTTDTPPPVPVKEWDDDRVEDEFMGLVAGLEWRAR